MKHCKSCKNYPSEFLKEGIDLSDKRGTYCDSGIYMHYKRPENENDTVFGFAQESCSGYCANGE